MNVEQYLPVHKIYFWLLVIVETTLFLSVKSNTWAIAALALFWILHTALTPGKLIMRRELWLFLGFFGLFAIGMLYTSNVKQGLRELDTRSALLVLPFILLTCKIKLGKNAIERLVVWFFYIGLIMGVVVLVLALLRYLKEHDASVFFYDTLTDIIGLHPVYFSYYLAFGLFGRYMIQYKSKHKNFLFWITNAFAVIMLVLLASKMVLALLFLIALFLLAGNFRSDPSFHKMISIVFFALIFVGSIFLFSGVRQRVSSAFDVDFSDVARNTYEYDHHFSGLSLRLVVWRLSLQHLYRDGLILSGVGTGDVIDYLNSVYAEHGLIGAGYERLNTHNEYIQTLVTLGVIGFLYLFFFYAWGLVRATREQNFLLTVFVLILSLSSLSEALLTVNKGIVFFSFWYPLLLLIKKENDQ